MVRRRLVLFADVNVVNISPAFAPVCLCIRRPIGLFRIHMHIQGVCPLSSFPPVCLLKVCLKVRPSVCLSVLKLLQFLIRKEKRISWYVDTIRPEAHFLNILGPSSLHQAHCKLSANLWSKVCTELEICSCKESKITSHARVILRSIPGSCWE